MSLSMRELKIMDWVGSSTQIEDRWMDHSNSCKDWTHTRGRIAATLEIRMSVAKRMHPWLTKNLKRRSILWTALMVSWLWLATTASFIPATSYTSAWSTHSVMPVDDCRFRALTIKPPSDFLILKTKNGRKLPTSAAITAYCMERISFVPHRWWR